MIYGHNRTVHGTKHLHVEVDRLGTVVAVWFRCANLPFEQVAVGRDRARDMQDLYSRQPGSLNAVDIDIPTGACAETPKPAEKPAEKAFDAMLAALKAQEALSYRRPNPFGHSCDWCMECTAKVRVLRQEAIKLAMEEE